MTFRARFAAYLRQHHLALIALFVAMGGVSYAAVAIPDNSVGTNQIRDGQVMKPDIRRAAVGAGELRKASVGTVEVKNDSLLCEDFESPRRVCGSRGGRGPAGPQGETGPTGPAGTSIAGLSTTTARMRVETIEKTCTNQYNPEFNAGTVICSGEETAVAACVPGEVATGGSASVNDSNGTTQTRISDDRPDPETGTPTGWAAEVTSASRQDYFGGNNPPAPPADETVTVHVVCAS